MNTSILLYIATFLAIIQYIAHAGLFLSAKAKHGKEEINVIKSMKSHKWNFSGFHRSYWDFYFGYGLLAVLWGIAEVFLFWQLAELSRIPTISITPFILILIAANVGHAILTLKYFFFTPAIFDLLIALTLVLAVIK